MSFSETIFLFFLALIVFGPKKLPEIARQIGKVLNEFRRASNEFKSQIEQEISNLEVEERKRTTLPASAAPEGTASRTLPSSEPAAGDSNLSNSDASSSSPSSAVTGSAEPSTAEAATLAAPAEATTTPANHREPEAIPAPEPVTSTASQESHV